MSSPGARETRAFANEIKFLVPRAVASGIRDWARRYLDPDPHGTGSFGDEYRINTIYFDSPDYDMFHRRGSFGRSKYRIRRYDDGVEVFLERKLRRPGMLAKRRTLIAASLLSRLEDADVVGWPGNWFHRRLVLRRLRPVCEISYQRVARAGMAASGPVRLTLDERLQVIRAERPAFGGSVEGVRLIEQQMILELKYRSEVPAIFKRLVEEFELRPAPTSKYRIGVVAIDPEGTGRGASAPLAPDVAAGLPCG